MSGIDDIKNIIAKIDLNQDGKISKNELAKAENKVPSVWLNRIQNFANGNDIQAENLIKGLSVEKNPANHPVISFNDERPELETQDWATDLQKVPTKEEYFENYIRKGFYDVTLSLSKPLNAELDFSKSAWFLQECVFSENTFANTPKEHLPEGFDPKAVIEKGKDPGLNARAVHASGITGKGVKVAIMDWQLPPSENYDSNIVSYKAQETAKKIPETMHGAAVTSILAGKETGVAPGADVYYFAGRQSFREEYSNEDMIKSFKNVLEINTNLPENEKIRIVSISGPVYGGEEAENLVKELEDSGVWVMSSPEFWKNFGYLAKKDPMGNPNDFDNHTIHAKAEGSGRQLYVNSGDRTVAHFTASADYRHDSKASASWAIPVVAGYYALACEADPSMTKERFLQLAEETAQVRELDLPKNENAQSDYERHQGFLECLIETIQKERPELTQEQCLALDEKILFEYEQKMADVLLSSSGLQMDMEELFMKRGKEVLAKRGEYDENGVIKDIPESYSPKEVRKQAKIIDIKALIDKIKTDTLKK